VLPRQDKTGVQAEEAEEDDGLNGYGRLQVIRTNVLCVTIEHSNFRCPQFIKSYHLHLVNIFENFEIFTPTLFKSMLYRVLYLLPT
jgi:hypothetical protein